MAQKIPQFWIVWREGTVPSYQHPSYQSALKEAERLARENGGVFHVFEHRAIARRLDVEIIETDNPF